MQNNARTIDRATAINILKKRALAKMGVQSDVKVTNVTFLDATGQPFVDKEWNEGKPYAIANFAISNKDDVERALEHMKKGEYQEAVNTNRSLRVSVELGAKLQESVFATVVCDERTVRKGEDDEHIELLITEARPMAIKSAKDSMAFAEDVFATAEETADANTIEA